LITYRSYLKVIEVLENEIDRVKKRLAQKIRLARREKNLTQGELAERMGVSQPFISKIEKGESMPGKKTLIRVSRALDLDDQYFIEQRSLDFSDSRGRKKSNEILDHLKNIEDMISRSYATNRLVPLSLIPWDEEETVNEVELPVGAGECFTDDNIIGRHALPRNITYGATHMLRVHGRSMEPYVMEGDMLLVVPQNFIEHNGQLAVVNVGNQVNSVKFVYVKGDQLGLGRSIDEAKWFDKDEVRIQGIVVSKISSYSVIRDYEFRAKNK